MSGWGHVTESRWSKVFVFVAQPCGHHFLYFPTPAAYAGQATQFIPF
jgi:hypothetical protein